MAYPFIDKGSPIDWPFYRLRVKLCLRFPRLYPLIWNDWRA